MRTTLIVFLFLVLPLTKLIAQDTIVLKTGDEIQAKIIEVNENEISYKKFNYQDGPTFVVSRKKVFMIKYSDGTHEVINKEPEEETANEDEGAPTEYGQNIIAINPFSFFWGNFSMSYEHINSRGKFGFRIPFNVPVFFSAGNQLGLSLDFKFYPWGQGKARYYIGPSVPAYLFDGYFITGIMLDNGVSFQPFKGFNITLDGAIGLGRFPGGNYAATYDIIFRGGINFGIRF